MKLIFLYGPAASGKLTIARELATLTGFALFHNHLVVDAVAAVFPFGSERFVKLREQFWLAMFHEAAEAGYSQGLRMKDAGEDLLHVSVIPCGH